MNEDHRTFARIGHFHNDTLLEIAIDSFLKFQLLKEENKVLKSKGHFTHNEFLIYNEEEKINNLENSLLKESIKIVTFLSSFLESYFFEFSAIALGQQYTENHIEKLDLTSKIIVIPRLVTGKEIDKSLHFWGEIRTLIKWRNKIIHNKTKNSIEFFKNLKMGNYDPKPLYKEFNLTQFLIAIQSLFKELDKIDPNGAHTSKINFNMKRIKIESE